MRIWWRTEPFSEWEMELYAALDAMHSAAALGENPSHFALVQSAFGSGDYQKAICAAILTFGTKHGPFVDCYDLLASHNPVELAKVMLAAGKKLPGWGTSFVRGEIPPIVVPVFDLLQRHPIAKVIDEVGALVPKVFPNPTCVTAASAIVLGVPRESVPFLLVTTRLPAWSAAFQHTIERSR